MNASVDYLKSLKISSSWIAGFGDVIEVGSYRTNGDGSKGRKMKPRKKRGRPMTAKSQQAHARKAAEARERRKNGFYVSPGQ